MCIRDRTSAELDVILMSPDITDAVQVFTDFMYSEVYKNPVAKGEESKVGNILYSIWEYYVNPVSYTHLDVYKRQVQDGPRKLYETVVSFEKSLTSFPVPFGMGDPDGLNYLAGRDLHDICRTARDAVKAAHISGGVPNIGVRCV